MKTRSARAPQADLRREGSAVQQQQQEVSSVIHAMPSWNPIRKAAANLKAVELMRVGDRYFANGVRVGEQNCRTLEVMSVHTDCLYTVTKRGKRHHYKTVRI